MKKEALSQDGIGSTAIAIILPVQKLEKELDKKIKRTPTDHPGYNEYQYHLDAIEHDPWQLTS